MDQPLQLPRIYPIVDAARFAGAADPQAAITAFVLELLRGGATLIQYRNKSGSALTMLRDASALREVTQGKAKLIMNDRADLCIAAHCDGVHLGQDDLSPAAARRIFNCVTDSAAAHESSQGRNRLWIGYSTHNPGQVHQAQGLPVDYLAIGPVFETGSKLNPDPVVGLQGVRAARQATSRPLVAIGGITRANCRQVLDAGADCVAIISDLVESPRASMEDFRRISG